MHRLATDVEQREGLVKVGQWQWTIVFKFMKDIGDTGIFEEMYNSIKSVESPEFSIVLNREWIESAYLGSFLSFLDSKW